MRLHVERAVKAVLKPPQDLRMSGYGVRRKP